MASFEIIGGKQLKGELTPQGAKNEALQTTAETGGWKTYSNKEWGVWGGVYLKEGKIDKEFNQHKDKESWFDTWKSLTMEST